MGFKHPKRRWRLVGEVLKDPRYITATAEIIIFRLGAQDQLEILVGTRHARLWNGRIEIGCAGYMDRHDLNPLVTACREAKEECGLVVKPRLWVGTYGPYRRHYTAELDHRSPIGFRIKATRRHAQIIPVLHHVFAGVVAGGSLKDSRERSGNHWENVITAVGHHGHHFAFDSALVLAELMYILRCPEGSPERVTAEHGIRRFSRLP